MKKPRPIRVEGDIAYVTLTRGMVAVIDAADVPLVGGRNWHAIPNRNTFYAAFTRVNEDGTHSIIQMQRLIMGADAGQLVDHQDGDGLNNRRKNIRLSTQGQNMMNRRRTSNKHGLKGVAIDRKRGKFTANITVEGKRVRVGRFDTVEDAARAYDAAAIIHYGEFAATNAMLGLV